MLQLEYDELVIGADINALYYAYVKKIPVIFIRKVKPYRYCYPGNYEWDMHKYEYFMHILSLSSLIPFSDKIQVIRLEDNNTLKITTKQNYVVNVKFNKLLISDDYKVEGLPEPIGKTTTDNIVVDTLGIDERNSMPSSLIERDDRVIKTIIYSKVVKRKLRQRLITVLSIMSDEELNQIEHSESYMKLRLVRIFSPKIKVFKHYKREISSIGKNIYNISDNIKTLTYAVDEIEKLERPKYSYIDYLEGMLWNRSQKLRKKESNTLPE